MSRDWRPAELYFADKEMNFREATFTMTDIRTGGEIELFKKPPEMKKAYPELSFLFDDMSKLYEKYGSTKAGKALFEELEQGLAEAERLADSNKLPRSFQEGKESFQDMYIFDDAEFYDTPPSTIAKEWFIGGLDDNFYYNERNNEAFSAYISKNIEKELLKEKRKNNIER